MSSDDKNEEANEVVLDPDLKKKLWMIRDCQWYDAEHADCKSIRSRFHQYFVYGETLDCSQWMRDSANCYRWKESKDVDSAKLLIATEINRREERLKPHYNNDVWENRTEPPENWTVPLPDWMQKDYENSFLAMKAEELRNGTIASPLSNRQSICTIL